MHWPFNYPGDEYVTNVFSSIVLLFEDVIEAGGKVVELIKDR